MRSMVRNATVWVLAVMLCVWCVLPALAATPAAQSGERARPAWGVGLVETLIDVVAGWLGLGGDDPEAGEPDGGTTILVPDDGTSYECPPGQTSCEGGPDWDPNG